MFILVLVVIFGTGVVSSGLPIPFDSKEKCEEAGKIMVQTVQEMGDVAIYRCIK